MVQYSSYDTTGIDTTNIMFLSLLKQPLKCVVNFGQDMTFALVTKLVVLMHPLPNGIGEFFYAVPPTGHLDAFK